MHDGQPGDPDRDDDRDPTEEIREMIREILSGTGGFDPSRLAGVAGLPADPALMREFAEQLQHALLREEGGIDWSVALEHATRAVASQERAVPEDEALRVEQAFRLAELWLGEATSMGELADAPRTMTRGEWVKASMPSWTSIAEPVATGIADTLTRALAEQVPPEMADAIGPSGTLLRNVGGAMFAMQLGEVVGRLATEVVSGGDIGIPVLEGRRATLLPQNVDAFAEGLDVPANEVELYLAIRELAHARLFHHAKWLPLHLVAQVREFAHGLDIDVSAIESLAANLDPERPEEIRSALESGAFIPPRSDQQEAALARIETMLALVEGWVDCVTQEAAGRLPRASALGEAVRRRRATGGPAEKAFASLVGLELRPRRLREAAAMWRRVADELGSEARDALWDHFDAVPTAEDIDDPSTLVARLRGGEAPAGDDLDAALASLLDDPDSFGDAPTGGVVRGAADRTPSGDPSDPRAGGVGGGRDGGVEDDGAEGDGDDASGDGDGPAEPRGGLDDDPRPV